MKKRHILFLFLLNILLFTKAANAQTDSAKLFLVNFYKLYIPTYNQTHGEDVKLQKKYSTAKLIAALPKLQEEMNCDPYVNAQDADQDWLRTLKVEKDAKTANLYNVSFFDNYEKKRFYVKVFVTKEKGQYKISGFVDPFKK